MHINVKFSNETDLKKLLDLLYEKSKTGNVFTGFLEEVTDEIVIITAIHNIKSNKGSKTTGADK